MRSRVRVLGHPAHPMLVMFPAAMLPLLLVLDIVHLWTGEASAWTAGFWIAAFGAVTTILAALPGIVDFTGIPNGTRAQRIAVFHLVVGVTVLVAYAAALFVRWPIGSTDQFALGFGIDIVGASLIGLQGWLGGDLVYRHHMGVKTRAEGGDPVPIERAGEPAPATGRITGRTL